MNIWGTFKIALRALSRNKLRSSLTMLGIIIGVGAVIAMVGIGQGASASIQSQIANLGNNMLNIFAGSSNSGGTRGGFARMVHITRFNPGRLLAGNSSTTWPDESKTSSFIFPNKCRSR